MFVFNIFVKKVVADWVNFIRIYLSGTILIIGIPFLGYWILSRSLHLFKPATQFFLQCFTGLLVLVSLYSIWKTNGVTFNIAIAAFLFFIFRRGKNDARQKRAILPGRFILSIFCLFTFGFLLKVVAFYNFTTHTANIPHNDVLYYTTLSDFIGQLGEENIYNFRNLADPSIHGLFPYHFFELWTNSFFVTVFQFNSLWTFELLTHPILLTLAAFGFYAVMAELAERRSIVLLLGLSALWLFFAGLSMDFPKLTIIPINGVIYPKLLVIYLFIMAFILFFLAGQFWLAVSTLLTLAWVNTAAAPGIYMGLFLYGGIRVWRDSDALGWKTMVAASLSAIAYMAWFMIFKSRSDSFATGLVAINSPLGAAKTWVVQFMNLMINYFVLMAALLWSVVSKRFSPTAVDSSLVKLLQLFLLIIVSGWLFSGLTQSTVSSQFAYNIYVPVMVLIIVALSSLLLNAPQKPGAVALMGLVALLLIYNMYVTMSSSLFSRPSRVEQYSNGFMKSTGRAVRELTNPLGLFIAQPAFFENSDLGKSEDYHYPAKYLKSWRSGVYLINYYPDKIRDSVSVLSKFYRGSCSLYSFAHQKNLPLSNLDAARSQFLSAFHPGFLVIQGGGFPPVELRKHIMDSTADSRSGEKMYRLKY